METLKSELSSEIADKFQIKSELPIVGKIKFLGFEGEVAETKYYTNSDEYLATIKNEIDYMGGFNAYTNPNYPELRKTVDDIFYSNCGAENPHSLDWYNGHRTIYNDESQGFGVEINLTKNQQSELTSIEAKLQDLKNLGVNDISLFSYDYKTDLYTDAEWNSQHELLDIPEISDKTGLNDIKESFHPNAFNSEHVIQKGSMKTTESIDSLLNRVQDKSIFLDYELCFKPGITEDEILTLNNGLDQLLQKTKANNTTLTQNIKSKAVEIPVVEKPTSNISQSLFEKHTLPADLSIKKTYNNPSEYLEQFVRKGKFDFKNFEIFRNDNSYLTGDFKFISENGNRIPKFDSLTLTNSVTHKQYDCMQMLNKLNENNVDILKLNPSHFEQLFSKNSLNLTDIKGKELFPKSLTDKPFNLSITRVGGKMFGFTSKIMNAFTRLNEAVMG